MQLGFWGSAHKGGLGGAPAEIEFDAFYPNIFHLVAAILLIFQRVSVISACNKRITFINTTKQTENRLELLFTMTVSTIQKNYQQREEIV